MAANVGTAYVTIMPSMNGFASQVSSGVSSAFSGLSGSSSKAGSSSGSVFSTGFAAKMGGIAGLASSAFSKVGSVVSGAMSSAVSRVDTLNQFPKVMSSLGFSSESANAAMQKLSSGIEGLPTSLDSITSSTQRIALLTGDLDLASDTALALNNAFLASGSSSEDASRGLTQYVQMLSKGKVDSQSWNSVLETMGSSLKTVATSLGYTSTAVGGDLYTALQDGTLSFDDFNQAIIDCNQQAGGFADTASAASAGIGTSMTNLNTAIVKNLANIISAINGSGAISGFFDMLKNAVNAAGSAIVPVAERIGAAIPRIGEALKSLSFSDVQGFFSGLASSMQGAGTPVEALRAALARLAEGFKGLTGIDLSQISLSFESLPAPIQSVLGALDGVRQKISEFGSTASGQGAIVTAVFTAILALLGGRLTGGVTAAVNAFKGLSAPLGAVQAGVSLLGTALSQVVGGGGFGQLASLASMGGQSLLGLVSPVSLVVAGIAALAAAFAYTMATNESFAASVMATVVSIGTSLAPVIGVVTQSIQQIATTVLPVLMSAVSQLAPVLAQIVAVVLQLFAALAPLVTQLVSMLAPIIVQIISTVTQLVSAVLPIVVTVLTTIMAAISALLPVISNVVSVVLSVASVVASAVSAILAVVTSVATTVISFISMVVAAIGTVVTTVTSVFSTIASVVTGAIATVVSVVSSGVSGVIGFFSNMVSAVGSGVSGLFSTVSSVFNNIANTVINLANSARQGAISAFNALKSGVTSVISSVFSTISSLPSQIMGVFSGAASWLFNSGASIINGLVSGIQSAIGGAVSAVSGAVSQIRSLFPFSPAKEGPFSGHGYTTWSGKALITDWGDSIAENASGAVASAKDAVGKVADELSAKVSTPGFEVGVSARGSAAYAASGAGSTVNNYYLTANVDTISDERFAEELVNLMYRWNVLKEA